jgi:cytochrome c peroxidase
MKYALSALLALGLLSSWSLNAGAPAGAKPATQPANDSDIFSSADRAVIETLSPLPDLPIDPTSKYRDSAAAALLGQKLFFEPRLSGPIQTGTLAHPSRSSLTHHTVGAPSFAAFA